MTSAKVNMSYLIAMLLVFVSYMYHYFGPFDHRDLSRAITGLWIPEKPHRSLIIGVASKMGRVEYRQGIRILRS